MVLQVYTFLLPVKNVFKIRIIRIRIFGGFDPFLNTAFRSKLWNQKIIK